jgi:hypothetical protein
MIEQGRVDVLVHCYNHRETIEKCLLSILNQTYREIFVTVIDDSSDDGSWEAVEALTRTFPERLVLKRTSTNLGSGAAARLECGFLPIGEFWGHIDGDDWWVGETRVEKQIETLKEKPLAIGCGGSTIEIDDSGGVIGVITCSKEDWSFLDWLLDVPALYTHVSAILWRNLGLEFEGAKVLNRPEWPSGEWAHTLAYMASTGGRLATLATSVSVYNNTGTGVWTSLSESERAKLNERAFQVMRKNSPPKFKIASSMARVGFKRLAEGLCLARKSFEQLPTAN